MNVSFAEPMRASWDRMVRMLFRPFSPTKWLVIGFAAFLSEGLTHTPGSRYSFGTHGGRMPVEVAAALHGVAHFLLHPVWGVLILFALTLACTVVLALLWVRSRGRFIFLDNVVHERAGIREPWRRFSRQGNALFLFDVVTLMLWGAALLAIILPELPVMLEAVANEDWKALAFLALGRLVLLAPLGTLMAFFYLVLVQFVVPIMYLHGIGPVAAWGRFFALFGRYPLHFVAFALIYLVLVILVLSAVLALGFTTCCVGFILLGMPYIGSVVRLPAEVFLRGLGPEFLAQFGAEHSVFAASSPGPVS